MGASHPEQAATSPRPICKCLDKKGSITAEETEVIRARMVAPNAVGGKAGPDDAGAYVIATAATTTSSSGNADPTGGKSTPPVDAFKPGLSFRGAAATVAQVKAIRGKKASDEQEATTPSMQRKNLKSFGNTIIAGRTFAKTKAGSDGLTAAQAITRLTGTIFDSDDQIPAVLRGPLVFAVSRSDQIAKTIETYKKQVDALIHWEVLTSSIYVTTALVWAYLLGRFGFSFAWCILVILFVANAFKRNLRTMKHRVAIETTRNLAIRRLENESETVEWFNKFVQRLWVQMEPSMSAGIKSSLEGTLAASNVSLPHFTLGSASPRIETIRTIAKTSDDVHLMDWDLNFTPVDEDDFSKREKELGDVRNSRIELVAKVGVVAIPVLVTGIEFKGKLRIGIKYMSKYPHIKLVEYSFLEAPSVAFNLRPLKSFDLMDIGLAGLVDGIIASSLKSYVEPNKNIIDIEAMFEGTDSDAPVGVLCIKVFEAKDLKNVELAGVSDPYVKVTIAGQEVCRSKAVDGSLNPYWGETYYIPIMKSQITIPPDLPPKAARPDEFKIHVFDKNESIADKSMGFTDTLKFSRWIKLLEPLKAVRKPTSDDETESALASDPALPVDIRGRVAGDDAPLTKVERDTLLAEWGSPFACDSDVWKTLNQEEGGKLRGELRVDMTYYPVKPPLEEEEEDKETAAKALAAAMESATAVERKRMEEAMAAKVKAKEDALKARAEREKKLKVGVLTVVVHQAKELPCGKSANPTTTVIIDGVRCPKSPGKEIGKTGLAKKTNNPVWDYSVPVYIEDIDKARLLFAVHDGNQGSHLGKCEVAVKDVVNKAPTDTPNDWFKLSGVTGKLRLSFKWQPVDVERCHDPTAIVRKEPLGMLKVKIIEAKGVANVEAFRKSDPYVKLHLSRQTVGGTRVRENTIDPVWNEIFYAVCYSRRQAIRMELFDFNKVKKDVSLGQVDLFINELLNPPVVHNAEGTKEVRIDEELDEDGNVIESHDAEHEMDPLREAWISRQMKDGFKVTRLGNVMDVWAPIYIRVNEDASTDDVRTRGVSAPPALLSATTNVVGTAGSTALNFVGFGPGAKAGQKGHLHFELELLRVDENHYIRPESADVKERESAIREEREAKACLVEVVEKDSSRRPSINVQRTSSAGQASSQIMPDTTAEVEAIGKVEVTKLPGNEERHFLEVPVGKPADTVSIDEFHETSESLTDANVTDSVKGSNEGIAMTKDGSRQQLKVRFETAPEILKEFPAGIIRFRIHRAHKLARPGTYYVSIVLDDEEAAHTRVHTRTREPEWEAPCDVFVKNMAVQKLKIIMKTAGEELKRSQNDRVVGVWEGDLRDIVGNRECVINLEGEGGGAQLVVSVGYAPIVMDGDEEGSKNMGVLYIDIVDAANLEAVDSGGTSDPYCVVDLNDSAIHRTAIHRKNLNPTFNETVMANVKSRLRSNVTITVRDHNTIGKHKILGTVSLQLARVKPEELLFASLPLQGARGGFLRLRLYFDPRILDESAFEPDNSRMEKREDHALGKLVKGGTGMLSGSLITSVEILAGKHGDPKQDQKGVVSAEEMAKLKGAEIRLLGDTRVGAARSESRQAIERSESRQELERSESRVGMLRPESGASSPPPADMSRSASRSSVMFADLIQQQEMNALSGQVSITIVGARDLKPVDEGGTSDPYVKVTQQVHGKVKTLLKTRVIKRTLNPIWTNETVVIKVPPTQIRLLVRDKNTFAESKPLGEVDVDLAKLLPHGETEFDAWLSLGLGGTGEIRITGHLKDHAGGGSTAGSAAGSSHNLNHTASTSSLGPSMLRSVGSFGSLGGPSTSDPSVEESRSRPLSPAASESGSVVTLESITGTGTGSGNGTPVLERKRFTLFKGKSKQ
ncbi:hypothetical protein HK101_004861 [Irineochytrium annulatum]|nr:hypothetical protein HK101_004861 [Irineochytrium annulatum]